MSNPLTLSANDGDSAAQLTSDKPENNHFKELIQTGRYDYYFERGQIVSGIIVAYQKDGVLVDVGAKSEAFLPMKEVADFSFEDPETVLPLGNEFEFYILRDEAGSNFDGRIVLSHKRVAQARSWSNIEEKKNSQEIFDAVVQDVVKGGVVVEVNGLRGFIPASHLRVKGGSSNPQLIGEKIPCTVLEIDKQLGKLILSQKVAIAKLYSVEREKLLVELVRALRANEEALSQGQPIQPVIVHGEVVRITDFGAFVKIGDTETDGLLPLSEISWKKIAHPSELLTIGNSFDVQVLNVIPEQSRISLSLKRLQPDPWDQIKLVLPRGTLVNGTVNKITSYGAFLQIEFSDPELQAIGFEGLLPIDEVSAESEDKAIETLDAFTLGQKLKAVIIKVKEDERKVTLSIKYLDAKGNLAIPLPPDPSEQKEVTEE